MQINDITELKGTFTGLKILEPENGSINVNSYRISPGRIVFTQDDNTQDIVNIWNFQNDYVLKDTLSKKMNGSTDNYPQLYSVYAKPDLIKLEDNIVNLDFFTVYGTPETNPVLPVENTEYIFLGMVFVPSHFPSSETQLFYRSVSIEEYSYNLIIAQNEWVKNLREKIERWVVETIYFSDMIVRYNDCLYICLNTHASSSSFATDLSDGYWIQTCTTGGIVDETQNYEVILVQNGTNGGVDGDKYYCVYEKIDFLDGIYGRGNVELRRLVTTISAAPANTEPIEGYFEQYSDYQSNLN